MLRAPVALRRVEWRAGAAGPGDRLRGLHRQLHRTARAFRDSRERAGAEPEPPTWVAPRSRASGRPSPERARPAARRPARPPRRRCSRPPPRACRPRRPRVRRPRYDDDDDDRDQPGPRGARAERDSRGRGARRGAGRAGRGGDAGGRAAEVEAEPVAAETQVAACRPSRSRPRRRSRRPPRSAPEPVAAETQVAAPAEVRPAGRRRGSGCRAGRRHGRRLPQTPAWIGPGRRGRSPPPAVSAVRAKWPLARWVGGAKGEPWRPRSGRAGSSRSGPGARVRRALLVRVDRVAEVDPVVDRHRARDRDPEAAVARGVVRNVARSRGSRSRR